MVYMVNYLTKLISLSAWADLLFIFYILVIKNIYSQYLKCIRYNIAFYRLHMLQLKLDQSSYIFKTYILINYLVLKLI